MAIRIPRTSRGRALTLTAAFSRAAVLASGAAAWIRAHLRFSAAVFRLARAFLWLFAACHVALFLFVLAASLVLSRWNPPVSSLMLFRDVTVGWKNRPIDFVALRQIPRAGRDMFIRVEDMKFYSHPGIDLGAIRDAYLVNKSAGRVLYGGSTIPQQLARTLFLTPRKTYFRKYVEALIALEMDLFLKKDRILELYLNYIEWGKGVYGIGAASSYYFHERPGDLSLDQLRRLVAILPNPLRFDVNTFAKSRQMAERYAYLAARFPDPGAAPATGDSSSAAQEPGQEPPGLPGPGTVVEAAPQNGAEQSGEWAGGAAAAPAPGAPEAKDGTGSASDGAGAAPPPPAGIDIAPVPPAGANGLP